MISATEDEVSLSELLRVLWAGKWHVTAITGLFIVLSGVYAFTATEWYRAYIVLAPADDRSTTSSIGQLMGLGGLTSLAGISVGSRQNVEPIAILRSRDLTRSFIEDRGLLPVLLADDWDEAAGRWKETDPAKQPDMRDAIRYFDQNLRRVSEDTETSLVTLFIQWTDPVLAADWANDLVGRLNHTMRERALATAEENVAYLRNELAETTIATLSQSIGTLLEAELQKLMLARGTEEFAFKVIDAAEIPKQRAWPSRRLILILGAFVGGIFSVIVIISRHAYRRTRSTEQGSP